MNTQAVTEQAPQGPSVEERAAAALFGSPQRKAASAAPPAPEPERDTDEPNEAAPPNDEQSEASTEAATDDGEAAPTAEETFEFEHDGVKWALPKALEKPFSLAKDYTQKSQEVANQRRALEVLNEQAKTAQLTRNFEASVKAELQKLAAYDEVLSQPINRNAPPEEVAASLANLYQWQRERAELANTVNQKHSQYMQEYEKATGELKAKALEAVSKRIPGWNDALWTSIREHAKADGYTDSELGAINDPRHQITLWKAQQYDALKSKATKTVADVKAVKTTPSNPMPQHVKEKLAFQKAIAKTTDPHARSKMAEARIGAMFRK